eukprot:Selendium_serpulae@DN6179_c0_g2_i6.p3
MIGSACFQSLLHVAYSSDTQNRQITEYQTRNSELRFDVTEDFVTSKLPHFKKGKSELKSAERIGIEITSAIPLKMANFRLSRNERWARASRTSGVRWRA